jgi:signal peptidase II
MNAKLALFLSFFGVGYGLDQLTKHQVVSRFYYGEHLEVIPGFFDLTYVRNPGGAFSMFATGPENIRLTFFIGAGFLAVTLLLVLYRRLEPNALLAGAALGAILGGALGNLTDRILYGEVIDFLDLHAAGYTFPTFNIADSCIVVGVAFLILEIFLTPDAEPEAVAEAGRNGGRSGLRLGLARTVYGETLRRDGQGLQHLV